MVKHQIEANPRDFSLWYTYVPGRNEKLNLELDAIITEHNTCPPAQSANLFRRYIIDDEIDFGTEVQGQLSEVISSLEKQFSVMSKSSGNYEAFLEQGLEKTGTITMETT